MKDQATLTRLLRKAKFPLRDKLNELLSPPLYLYLSAHDTGTQARIELRAPNVKTITVWEGSIWNSHSYEFNDRNKVLGMNPDAMFAQGKVEAFFAEVERLMEEKSLAEAKSKMAALARDNCETDAALAAYREMLGQ